MAGGGLGNVDPRQQRNPSTASPFGGSISRPMTQDVMSPSSFPAPSVYGRPMQPYGMQPMQPYGMPHPHMQPGYQGPMPTPMSVPKPMPSLMRGVEQHTHGENGEIIQEAMPLIQDQGVDSKMAQYQAQYQAQLAHDNRLPPRDMSPGADPMLQRVGGVQSFYK